MVRRKRRFKRAEGRRCDALADGGLREFGGAGKRFTMIIVTGRQVAADVAEQDCDGDADEDRGVDRIVPYSAEDVHDTVLS